MRDKSLAKLAFLLFLLTTATLFLRPAELFIWLEGAPIYEALILGTFVLSFQSFLAHFRQFMLARQPITLCVLGVFAAIALFVANHLWSAIGIGAAFAAIIF